jgi:hypothetical protein
VGVEITEVVDRVGGETSVILGWDFGAALTDAAESRVMPVKVVL